jgi:hypothetical protein
MYDQSNDFTAATRYLTEDQHNKFFIVKTAVHWQHKYFTLDDKPNQWAIFDFTKDWSLNAKEDDLWNGDEATWTRKNITSSELIITDNGGSVRNYDDVWVRVRDKKLDDADANDPNKIHIEN